MRFSAGTRRRGMPLALRGRGDASARRGGMVREAVAACVRPGATIDPVDAWIEPYAEARQRFTALYPALRDAA